MEQDKVDIYMVSHSKFFPANKIQSIRESLLKAEDSKYALVMSLELKDPTVMLLVSIFGGVFGIDRFMIGDIPMGILKLCTEGVCYVLYIIDWFLIQDKAKEVNYEKVMSILM